MLSSSSITSKSLSGTRICYTYLGVWTGFNLRQKFWNPLKFGKIPEKNIKTQYMMWNIENISHWQQSHHLYRLWYCIKAHVDEFNIISHDMKPTIEGFNFPVQEKNDSTKQNEKRRKMNKLVVKTCEKTEF